MDMIENYLRACIRCGGKTIKEDVCSACRKAPKGEYFTRAETNVMADAVLSTPREEAKKRYDEACYTIKILGGDAPESVWQEKKQMLALLNREVIDQETLT